MRRLLVMCGQTLLMGIMIACMSATGRVSCIVVERRMNVGAMLGSVNMMLVAQLVDTCRVLSLVFQMMARGERMLESGMM